MKFRLYVMGQYRGVTEVDDNSLIGCLARLDMSGAAKRCASLQKDLRKYDKKAKVGLKAAEKLAKEPT